MVGSISASPDRLIVCLDRAPDGRVRIEAVGPAGRAEATGAWPDLTVSQADGDEGPDRWAEARRAGGRLYAAAFPPPVQRLLDESRHARGDAPLPIALELADPDLAALPWELLRDPETERFLALSRATPLSRRLLHDAGSPARPGPPAVGDLRVGLVVPVADEAAMAGALRVGADARVRIALQPVGVGGAPQARPAVVQLAPGVALAAVAPDAALVVIDGDDESAHPPLATGGVVRLPAAMPADARTLFLAEFYAALAAGQAPDAAMTTARRKVADERSLTDLAWAQPVLAVAGTPAPLVVPRRRLARVGTEVRERTAGWVADTLSGVVASVAVFVFGLVLFRFGFSSSAEFEVDILSPFALFESFKALIAELSAFQELFLLGAGAVLLTLTVVTTALWLRHRRDEANEDLRWHRRLSGAFVSLRAVSFLAVATLTVLGSYAYQQYRWRVEWPIPDGPLGVAITRDAAAASVQEEFADALFAEGQAAGVVVRELPIKFDARDTDKARALGKRIGAEAVVIYRADAPVDGGPTRYVAYVVFTDPKFGLAIGGGAGAATELATDAAATIQTQQGLVQIKPGIEVPALQTETLSELVNASAGIIAYDEDRGREAITQLELALPKNPDAPNTGIVNFYLGNAYNLADDAAPDDQTGPAALAYERAAAFYDRRRQAGDQLGPQDELILVQSYAERGHIAAFATDYAAATEWYTKGVALREDLLARAGGLERPADVHATFARLYTLLADAYRAQGKPEEQAFWKTRATTEIDELVRVSDPNEPRTFRDEGTARFFLGDCVRAVTALDKALALEPDDPNAGNAIGIVNLLQGRSDLALDRWRRITTEQADPRTTRELLASVYSAHALGDEEFFEPAYLDAAEAQFRELLRLDPTNANARLMIADLAGFRADAAASDMTAITLGDALTQAKSNVLWRQDPARRQAALDALATQVEQHRIVATELRPGDPTAEAALATAYNERQKYVHSLLVRPQDNKRAPLFVAAGDQLVSDVAQIRAWTDKLLAPDSTASRLDRLTAWAARLDALQNEWYWYNGHLEQTATADRLKEPYRQAVAEAVAFADAAPVTTIDEAMAAGTIYLNASFVAQFFDGDEAAGEKYQQRFLDVHAQEQADERASTEHLETSCTEAQEIAAGDALIATNDLAGARTRYEAALAANPAHPDALNSLGRVLYAQGDIAGAVANATTGTEVAPGVAALWGNLGRYHLVAADAAGRDAAYARFLEVVAPLPPQERMARLRAAVADLRELIDDKPELRPRVLEVVPLFARALDGMSGDATGTFQYPQAYAELGALALDADGAAAAVSLLRRSVELDLYQPVAHADLALALAAAGQDATAASASARATAMTRDLLWHRTAAKGDVSAATLLDELDAEARRYLARYPERAAATRSLTDAVAAERAVRAAPAVGVIGNAYTGLAFGHSLSWEEEWSVASSSSASGFDSLMLTNETNAMLFNAYASEATTPALCLARAQETYSTLEGISDYAPQLGADGQPLRGEDQSRAFAVFTLSYFDAADGTTTPWVHRLECRALGPDGAVLQIVLDATAETFEDQTQMLDRLLATLTLPGGRSALDAAAAAVQTSVPVVQGTPSPWAGRARISHRPLPPSAVMPRTAPSFIPREASALRR